MECFVTGPLESDSVVLSVALSTREDVASNQVELVGSSGHGVHAKQDFEMLDGTGGWNATGSNCSGKPRGIGYQDPRRHILPSTTGGCPNAVRHPPVVD